jgi:hypothetical protein
VRFVVHLPVIRHWKQKSGDGFTRGFTHDEDGTRSQCRWTGPRSRALETLDDARHRPNEQEMHQHVQDAVTEMLRRRAADPQNVLTFPNEPPQVLIYTASDSIFTVDAATIGQAGRLEVRRAGDDGAARRAAHRGLPEPEPRGHRCCCPTASGTSTGSARRL